MLRLIEKSLFAVKSELMKHTRRPSIGLVSETSMFSWTSWEQIIREFSIGLALWVSEVLCCLYWRSSYLINHILFWWMDVAVNWSMLCQECRRAVFWARCCSFCTSRNFFPFWRISLCYADDSTLMAVVPSPDARVTVAESLNRDLVRVNAWCDLLGDEIECE